jgi:protein-glutamine gamma-glutamyltransferase
VISGAEVSVAGSRRWAVSRSAPARRVERPFLRLATFGALALYGVLRWQTLIRPAPEARLLGLLALALVVAGAGAWLAERHRRIAIALSLIAVVAIFPIAGVPLSWVRHVRLEVGANAIGQGLTALPNALVPYLGINHWVRIVIVLGAGVLLLDAALLAAFAPRSLGDLRRAGAALPLVALAVVPTTIVKPHLAYLQGLILFVLLASFLWAEHTPRRDGVTAIAVIGLAGLGGLIAGPRIDPHRAWINYRSLASALAPRHVDRFDWSQRYGPLKWPQHGRAVLDVQAARPEYWKAENLDLFDGRGWAATSVGSQLPADAIQASARAQWTETLQVTLRAMRTVDVIAAGDASEPTSVASGAVPGLSPGTWVAAAPLRPGDSYRVSAYSPLPSPAQLAAAGTNYPVGLSTVYLELNIPLLVSRSTRITSPPEPALAPQFGTPAAAVRRAATAFSLSPYAGVYALARRLEHRATTPYAFVENVLRYLAHGYTYDQAPPVRRYPLESFLFTDKRGYCQQFAGAMALLLRMGGVPARVAVGFTQGTYDRATRQWVVTDTDAHAWVEAWFPGYGWVRFDPTPPSAPALGGKAPAGTSAQPHGTGGAVGSHGLKGPVGGPTQVRHAGGSSLSLGLGTALIAALLALGAAWLAVRMRRRSSPPSGDQLLAELERALRRSGRPIADGVTLAALEQRFGSSPGAAGYVRAIRLDRYGKTGGRPTSAQRQALRAQLAAGLGLAGRLRALWALPPRR